MFSVEYVINFLIGLLGSLFSAWIFIQYLVKRYRPKIEISPFIAFNNNTYWFKFINLSKHDTFDIQILLELRLIESCGNNQFHSTFIDKIALKVDYLSFIPTKNKNQQIDTGEHCVQISTKENLHLKFNNKNTNFLVLQIVLKDSKSGLSKNFRQTYNISSIISGEFIFGESVNIKQVSPS